MSYSDQPFIVLSEITPNSHPAFTSPYFVRSVKNAIEPLSLEKRGTHGNDPALNTSIAGVVISSFVGVVQIGLQAQGNHIAAASLQLAQVLTGSEHAHRIANDIGTRSMAAVSVLGSAASGIALSGAERMANGVYGMPERNREEGQWPLSFGSLSNRLASLNPFLRRRLPESTGRNADDDEQPFTNRDVRILSDGSVELYRILDDGSIEHMMTFDGSQFANISIWAHNDLVRRACELEEEMFAIGSTVGSDDGNDVLGVLDAISEGENPWEGEGDHQLIDNFQGEPV